MAKLESPEGPPEMHGHLEVGVDDLPEIKKWKVGKEYTLQVRVKMTALRDGEYGEKGLRGSFEVKDAKVSGEDVSREKSPEEKKADKISNKVKKGRTY